MKVVSEEQIIEEASYLRLLIYGEPGVGKTYFGASASLDESTAPVLFLSYRCQIGGLRSNPAYMEAIDTGALVLLEMEQYKDLSYVHTWLSGRPVAALDELFSEPPKTLVIDSITEIQRAEILRRADNPEGRFLVDVAAPQIRQWGELLGQFTLLANLFYHFPMHVVFCGLEDVEYQERTGVEPLKVSGYRLAMQGKAQRHFPAYAMTVMRLVQAPPGAQHFNVGYTRAARTATKEQTGMFPATIGNPTIPGLVGLLKGARDD